MQRILAAGGLVLNQDNELLMIYRRLLWDLPKGHLDKHETLEQCAVREVQEETGLQHLRVKEFLGTTEHVYYERFIKEEAVKETHWFVMEGDKNEMLVPLMKESIERVIWVPLPQVKTYLRNSFDNIEEIIKKAAFYQSFLDR